MGIVSTSCNPGEYHLLRPAASNYPNLSPHDHQVILASTFRPPRLSVIPRKRQRLQKALARKAHEVYTKKRERGMSKESRRSAEEVRLYATFCRTYIRTASSPVVAPELLSLSQDEEEG